MELDLPATDYELLDAMEQLRLENGKHPYLEFHAVEEYDYLNKRIPETDIFPLNALAKRLAELDTRGMAVFEELGRFLVENGFIPETDAISDAALEPLDYAQIGKNHREAEGSTFTGFGYVERHSELRQVYKTLDLTPKKPAYTILAETFDGNREKFPYPADTPMGTEIVRCVDCVAPSLIGLTGGMEPVDLLARRLAGLEPKALTAYKALLEATDCKDLQSAEALIDSLDEYIFSPQYSSPIEMAKGELSVILCDEDAAFLAPHLNLYRYGQSLIERCGGSLTAYGLIEREDHQPVQAIENKPCQGGMEMRY